MNLGVCPPAVPKTEFEKSDVYPDFFARTLDFAAFSQTNRPPQATAVGIVRKRDAWDRIQEQVRKAASRPDWWRKELIDQIGEVFCKLPQRIGSCRYP